MRRRTIVLAAALLLALLTGPRLCAAQGEAIVRGGSVVYPAFEVNIDDGGGLGRLRIGFEVQCTDEQAAKLAATGQAREAILLFFRDQAASQLLGPKGRDRLRADLLKLLNTQIGGPRAIRLYFLEYLVLKAGTP
ncbi:flagellar basal body-associated FliL family protein [Solidesulfovibrio sp.]